MMNSHFIHIIVFFATDELQAFEILKKRDENFIDILNVRIFKGS